MIQHRKILVILIFLLLIAVDGIGSDVVSDVVSEEPIYPLPISVVLDQDKVALGHSLFRDKRLSANNTISCSSCHSLAEGGADNKPFSSGIHGVLGEINTPTIFNSGLNFRQFWNGRVKTLEDQIDGPLKDKREMDSNWKDVIAKLSTDLSYQEAFRKIYGGIISENNIKNAIATFERTLTTPNSKFDRFLRGEKEILSAQEKMGYQRFKSFGCVACHQGINVGGNMFQTMGVMGKYFKDRKTPITDADLGRFIVTKEEEDRHVFRVPSLRNVALTSPYFHDGSAQTLERAIEVMAKYQLGRRLTIEEIDSIVAFLKTLTGEKPEILESTRKPEVFK